MSWVVNREVVTVWDMDVTGEAANITSTLTRYPDSSTETSATETVTIAEIGSTGSYWVTFTPTNGEQVYKLNLLHDGGAAPTYRSYAPDIYVEGGADEATENRSYAAVSDVVARVQMGPYDGSSAPTIAQVRGFLEERSAHVFSKLGEIMGDDATGPSGYSTTIDNSSDAGLALERATRKAAATGAAIDAMQAAKLTTTEVSERINLLNALWEQALVELEVPAVAYGTYSVRPRTHIAAGQVSRKSVSSVEEAGHVVDMDTLF